MRLQQLVEETEILASAQIGETEFELSRNTRTGSYTAATSRGHAWFPSTVKDRRDQAIGAFLQDIADELAMRYQ